MSYSGYGLTPWKVTLLKRLRWSGVWYAEAPRPAPLPSNVVLAVGEGEDCTLGDGTELTDLREAR